MRSYFCMQHTSTSTCLCMIPLPQDKHASGSSCGSMYMQEKVSGSREGHFSGTKEVKWPDDGSDDGSAGGSDNFSLTRSLHTPKRETEQKTIRERRGSSLHSTEVLNNTLAEELHAFEHLARFLLPPSLSSDSNVSELESMQMQSGKSMHAISSFLHPPPTLNLSSVGECLVVLERWKEAFRTYKKLKATDRPILLSSIWRRLRLLQYHYRGCTNKTVSLLLSVCVCVCAFVALTPVLACRRRMCNIQSRLSRYPVDLGEGNIVRLPNPTICYRICC